ncbi:hypothetical protein LTS08_003359 [Lithohypha guttulata]|nr:hypothetical protein LTS08_003359 [Lithohypha guttulata]
MAKVAKPKREPLTNPRSRAARRATSPSINTDKSLKEAPRATETTPILAAYKGAGIHKKAKKKQLSHAQRQRQEKVLQKAEAVHDILESKRADASSRLKRRQGRRALWDDINDTSTEEVRKAIKAPGRFDTLDDGEDAVKDGIQPFHGETEIKVIAGVQVPTFATGQSMSLTMGPTLLASSKKPGTFGTAPKPENTNGTAAAGPAPTNEAAADATLVATLEKPITAIPVSADAVESSDANSQEAVDEIT